VLGGEGLGVRGRHARLAFAIPSSTWWASSFSSSAFLNLTIPIPNSLTPRCGCRSPGLRPLSHQRNIPSLPTLDEVPMRPDDVQAYLNQRPLRLSVSSVRCLACLVGLYSPSY